MKNTRTRWLYAVGAPVACAAVVIAGTVAANAAMAPRPAAAPAADLQFGAPAPAKSAPASSAPGPSAPTPLGEIISSGIAAKTGEWVFYAQAIDEKQIPQTHFGIMAGRRLPGGDLTGDVMTNETEGSDRAPGFHAVQGSMEIEAGKSPTFGYYVGPAAKITAVAGGKTVTAKHAVWSEDPSVVVFWFAPSVPGAGKLAAFDKAGKKLTTGNSGIGVG